MTDGLGYHERLTALSDLRVLTQGPSYNRGVATSVADFQLFAGRGETRVAEHHLLLAEMRAGVITWDEYRDLDPLR